VGMAELGVLRAVSRKAMTHPGLPQLFAEGVFDGRRFVVTELLGSPLSKLFCKLEGHKLERKWPALRVVGRLLLRRLRAVHECGYLHCDVSPENVLMGPARQAGAGRSQDTLYLIDFGHARAHPNGPPLAPASSSLEWSSIRSGVCSVRRPADDLEALGWVVLQGLFGELPWFRALGQAYAFWDTKSVREGAVLRAMEDKRQLLEQGFDSNPGRFRKLVDVPQDLAEYLRVCRSFSLREELPDYGRLLMLFGAPEGVQGLGELAAEEQDLREYQALLVPLLY